MKKTLFTMVALIMSIPVMAQSDEGIDFDTSKTWQELLARSAATNKLIFLDCYTTWCGPCKGMAEQVFTQKEVGDFMNANFICTKRDMEKGEGVELNQKYKSMIPGFPTYLIINSQGEVVSQASGFMAADKFISAMKDALEQKSWIAYRKRFEAGESSWDFYREYLDLLEAAYQKSTLEPAKNAIVSQLDYDRIFNNKSAYLIFKKYWTDVTSPMFRQFMSNSSVYRNHKDSEADVLVWTGRLYEREVKNITDDLVKNGDKNYDATKSAMLFEDMKRFSFKGREEQIAMLMANDAIVKNQVDKFFSTVDYARSFGLMRYRNTQISDLCAKFLSDSKDKKVLAKCLEYTKVDLEDRLLIPSSLMNYACFLEKTGDSARAAVIRGKAEQVQKELEEKFGGMLTKTAE